MGMIKNERKMRKMQHKTYDTVGEFGIAVRSGLDNTGHRLVKTSLLPMTGLSSPVR
jgi:hypothetical protein